MRISELAHSQPKDFRHFNWRTNAPLLGLTGLIVAYIAAIMALHVINYSRYRYGFDLSFYEQSVWNTVHGRFLQVSATDFSSSLLGTDAILILALMAPFYAIVPSPFTLLFLETLVVGLAALPVYWLARDHLRNRWVGLILAAAYLFQLSVQNGNLYEWRERPLAMGFLLFAFYYYERGRFKTFWLFAVLALCCRPENGLVLAMLALYGFVSGYPKKFGWRFVVGPLVLGLVWFGLVVAVVIPASSSGHSFALAENYGSLGSSPGDILKNLVTQPLKSLGIVLQGNAFAKLVYIPLLLLPFLFLPLGSPTVLLMALPPLALNILSDRPDTQCNPYNYHYQGSIIPWLVIATIFTIEKLALANSGNIGSFGAKLQSWRKRVKFEPPLLLAVAVLLTTLLIYLIAPVNPLRHALGPSSRPDYATAQAILKEIPADAPLAISNLWADQVPMRQGLWYLWIEKLYSTQPLAKAQYAFIDQRAYRTAPAADVALVEGILHNPDWQTVAAKGNYILLKRKS